MYTAKKQPSRLGQFEQQPRFENFGEYSKPIRKNPTKKSNLGNFGQSDTVSGIIASIGQAVNGIVSSITNSKVLTAQSKDRAHVAIVTEQENTKRLQIATEGQVEEAQIGVQQTKASYSGMTTLVVGGGVVLAVILIAAAYSYSIASSARGEYEVEYQTA